MFVNNVKNRMFRDARECKEWFLLIYLPNRSLTESVRGRTRLQQKWISFHGASARFVNNLEKYRDLITGLITKPKSGFILSRFCHLAMFDPVRSPVEGSFCASQIISVWLAVQLTPILRRMVVYEVFSQCLFLMFVL